jgi:FkbM family methyltransferase
MVISKDPIKRFFGSCVKILAREFPAVTAKIIGIALPYILTELRKEKSQAADQLKNVFIENNPSLRWSTIGYGQEGEDVLLKRFLGGVKTGFFVDVGAHHPIRFSNTYSFYLQGWRGINIDASPGSMDLFNTIRPLDINIECAVSSTPSTLDFHVFKEAALNTFDLNLANSYIREGWELQNKVKVNTRKLKDILDDSIIPGTEITLLSIDVEGMEMEVLQSNDWEKYGAKWIIIEALDVPLDQLSRNSAVSFLIERGYVPISKLCQSVILQRV